MTEKEFRKLNKRDLLEMLIFQTKRADDLQTALDEANEKLESREILFTNAGSLAEASIRLNGVFEAADAAIAQYFESVGAGGEALAASAAPGDASQMQSFIAEAEARLRMKEAELQQREAVCAERERAAASTGIAFGQSNAYGIMQPPVSSAAPMPDMAVLSKELDERKTQLDEREKTVTEREFYCSQALDSFAVREQGIAGREAAVTAREVECTAREAAFADREAEIERRGNSINSYIFAMCEQMKKVSADCDGIKQMATAFAEGGAGAADNSAGGFESSPDEGSSVI